MLGSGLRTCYGRDRIRYTWRETSVFADAWPTADYVVPLAWRCLTTGWRPLDSRQQLRLPPRKAALLRASLGPEGARIYYSLATGTGETYQAVVERMEPSFWPCRERDFQPCAVHVVSPASR